MLARYGNQWANQFSDERVLKLAMAEWQDILKNCDKADIAYGLQDYRGVYPPNAMQFLEACLNHDRLPAPCYKEYESDPNALEQLKSDQKTGRSFLDKIKGDLK
jgi:hypothetical protein